MSKRKTKSKPRQAKSASAKVTNQAPAQPLKTYPDEFVAEQKNMLRNGFESAIFGGPANNIFGSPGVQLSQADTLFRNNRWYLVSNLRQLLSEVYVEIGLVQTIVDVPVDDALRGGIEIKSKQLNEEQIQEITMEMDRENDLVSYGQAAKWKRLFGGAAVLVITDQDPATPLDLNALKEGEKLAFKACDLWELFWAYFITNGVGQYGQDANGEDFDFTAIDDPNYEFYDYYGIKIHKSRVIRMKGIEAPSFVRPRLRGWGLSVVETLVRSINQYLKATDLVFEVLDEFKIDVFMIKGLAQTLMDPDGEAAARRRIQLANREKNYLNAITMDGEDKYEQKELSFAGIAETMAGIRMQVASDMRMPLTKIFGISSAGFNSGEDDLENYNAMVESHIRHPAKFEILKMTELRCQVLFGFIPDDLSIGFKPLRILSGEQEENVKTQQYNRLLAAKQAGEITSLEFRQACNKNSLLPIQLETDKGVLELLPSQDEEDSAEKEPKAPASKAPKSTLAAPEAKTAKNSLNEKVKAEGMPKIVTVGLVSKGYTLAGQRNDNAKWTNPGGHMDAGESPTAAALREVEEETGIKLSLSDLNALPVRTFKSHRTGKMFMVIPFIAELPERVPAKTFVDPDNEIKEWRWVSIDAKTQELLPESRHAKSDVIVEYLLKKGK